MLRGDRELSGRALGVDLGGSSTRVHLLDPVAAPRDLHLRGGNVALDRGAVLALLLPLFLDTRPRSACLGLAGARTSPDAAAWVQSELVGTGSSVTVMTDAELAIRGAFGAQGDGILVCAGTGTVAVARVGDRIELVGGAGYLLGDAGGAYDIGRRIVIAALRERDLGGHELGQELEEGLGTSVDEIVASVYRSPADRGILAQLSQRVDAMHHPAADRVLDDAAQALVDLARTAEHRFGPLPIKLTGGVFRSDRLRMAVTDELGASMSLARSEQVAAWIAAEAL